MITQKENDLLTQTGHGTACGETEPKETATDKIDGGGIEPVNGLIEFDTEGFIPVQTSGLLDQPMSEVGVNSPEADLIGMDQSVAKDVASNAHVIKLGRSGAQAGLDVSEVFAVSQFGKRHREKLIPTRKALDFVVAMIAHQAAAKVVG